MPKAAPAKPSFGPFAFLVLQLASLLTLISVFGFLDTKDAPAIARACLIGVGFCVHYWLPVAYKRPFWAFLGAVALLIYVPAVIALAIVGVALAIYPLVTGPFRFATKVAALLIISATVVLAGRQLPDMGGPYTDAGTTMVVLFGSMFAVRMIIYLTTVRHAKTPPPFSDYATYFFAFPTHMLQAVFIDYRTLTSSFMRRDATTIAQAGIGRMALGLIQAGIAVAAGRALTTNYDPHAVHGALSLFLFLVAGYLKLLAFSGHGHYMIGIFMLFGFDMPKLHNNYGLATSPLDFWRRNNIYNRDVLVRLVYLPTYLSWRKPQGEKRATMAATALVFAVIVLTSIWTHAWLDGWQHSPATLAGNAVSYHLVLGLACTLNSIVAVRRGRRDDSPAPWWRRAIFIAATIVFMALALQLEWLGGVGEWVALMSRGFE
jgi:hypothetical protein